MLKRLILCIAFCAMLSVQTVSANEIRVFLNNSEIIFDQPPEILNDRTMVPVRKIFEAMGMVVQWNSETNGAMAFNDKYSLSFFVGEPYIYVNNEVRHIDTAPVILNSRMLVPVRAVAEATGCGVDWDGETGRVLITSTDFCDMSVWPKEVLRFTNEIRAEYGLDALIWNDTLAETAYKHSLDMSERGFFDHVNPDGETPFDRMKNAGISYTAAAENIAAGQSSPESVIEAWMNSPGHRKNILNPEFKELGAGFARGGQYGIYWTQNFAALR